MKSHRSCPALLILLSTMALAAERQQKDDQSSVQPLIAKYCTRCHGPAKQEADLRLDNLSVDFLHGDAGETWHDVLNRLNRGEMPPENEPQLSEEERDRFVGWLTAGLKRAAESRRSTGGRVVLRRLTRYEYNNTLRDLLGIRLDYAKDLPPEPFSSDGFKNNGSALGMSPLQMEYYLKTARMALGKAIVTGPKPQLFHQQTSKTAAVKRKKLPAGNQLWGDGRFLMRLSEYPTEGEIRVRVQVGAVIPETAGYPRLRVSIGLRSDTVAPEKILGEADVTAPVEQPETIEFRGRIEEFPLPGHNPKYPGVLITLRNAYANDVAGPQRKKGKKKNKNKAPGPDDPVLVIKSVEFEGPLFESWPPASHQRILFEREDAAATADEPAYAREVIERFMARAYRRPVSPAEVDAIFAFYQKARPQFETLEETLQDVLAMVLISPDFLYLTEPRSAANQREPLTDYELASRLSYFLWSTMPNERLFKLAGNGQLRDRDVLAKQIREMIADPRSDEFVQQFTDQWLNLSGVDRIAVNPEYYPGFDDRLKRDMRQETQLFFAEILRQDLSCLNLIDSDFTMLNRRLAKHYQIDGPRGEAFERVALAAEHRRGGLLAQGSILLTNSTGEDSHPIKRGVWLLERLLDDPPPPPPPDVPELKQDEPDFAALPLKRQLEIHREKAACNSCHRGIDPWGIPFEHYDAIGEWRSEVRRVVKGKTKQTPVVATAELPGGHEIAGLDELKQHLLKHERDRFARALVTKLLSYSLGRSLELTDRETVEQLAEQFAAKEFRLSELIIAIAQSEPFQTK